MRRIIVIVAVCAVALAALTTAAAARSSDRPFKGSLEGSVLFVPDERCTNNEWLLRTDSIATGNVSHLGKTEMTGNHCTPAAADVEGGEMILVAANGDEVHIDYSGFAPPPDPETGLITVDIEYVITGGNGRFAEASGGGDMTVEVVFEGFEDMEWPATWSWTGRIDY
jgi:hypothetical protein